MTVQGRQREPGNVSESFFINNISRDPGIYKHMHRNVIDVHLDGGKLGKGAVEWLSEVRMNKYLSSEEGFAWS